MRHELARARNGDHGGAKSAAYSSDARLADRRGRSGKQVRCDEFRTPGRTVVGVRAGPGWPPAPGRVRSAPATQRLIGGVIRNPVQRIVVAAQKPSPQPPPKGYPALCAG